MGPEDQNLTGTPSDAPEPTRSSNPSTPPPQYSRPVNPYPAYQPASPPKRKMPVWGWVLIGAGALGCLALVGIAAVAALGLVLSRTSERIAPTLANVIPVATVFQSGEDHATVVPSGGDHTEATRIAPSDSGNLEAQPLEIIDTWYTVDTYSTTQVYYAFIIENPNQDLTIQDAEFQTVAYDASGTILGTSEDTVYTILPGATLGISGYYGLSIPENSKVAEIAVNMLYPGDPVEYDLSGDGFSFDKTTFFNDEYSKRVTTIITNHYDLDIYSPYVSAIAYDQNGKIIGSGMGYDVTYLPAGGTSPATLSMNVAGEVDHVDVYVTLSYDYGYDEKLTTNLPTVIDQGFGDTDEWGYLAYGALLQNPADGQVLQYVYYMVDFYDASGTVLAISTGTIYSIFPGETQGITGSIQIPAGYLVDHMDVRISPADTSYDSMGIESAGITSNPLAAENITLIGGDYDTKITAMITNSWNQSIGAEVIIIAYAANGEIIGGGYGYVTSVPANGSAAVEVYLYLIEDPVRVDVYPSISSFNSY